MVSPLAVLRDILGVVIEINEHGRIAQVIGEPRNAMAFFGYGAMEKSTDLFDFNPQQLADYLTAASRYRQTQNPFDAANAVGIAIRGNFADKVSPYIMTAAHHHAEQILARTLKEACKGREKESLLSPFDTAAQILEVSERSFRIEVECQTQPKAITTLDEARKALEVAVLKDKKRQ